MPTQVRTVLVPDLELAHRLHGLEEFLLGFAGAEPGDVDGVPEPIASDTALDAVRRMWRAVTPSQHDGRGNAGRLLTPHGHGHGRRPWPGSADWALSRGWPSDGEVVGVVEEVYEQPIPYAVGRAGWR
jgi:hypothetical protein